MAVVASIARAAGQLLAGGCTPGLLHVRGRKGWQQLRPAHLHRQEHSTSQRRHQQAAPPQRWAAAASPRTAAASRQGRRASPPHLHSSSHSRRGSMGMTRSTRYTEVERCWASLSRAVPGLHGGGRERGAVIHKACGSAGRGALQGFLATRAAGHAGGQYGTSGGLPIQGLLEEKIL